MESSEPSRLGSFLSIDMSSAISFKDKKAFASPVLLPHYDYPSTAAVVPTTITTNDLQYRENHHRNVGGVAATGVWRLHVVTKQI
jgi:hypothetical protein